MLEDKIDELYDKYLLDKLDLIFDNEEGTSIHNSLTPLIYYYSKGVFKKSYLSTEKILELEELCESRGYKLESPSYGANDNFLCVGRKKEKNYEYNIVDLDGNLQLDEWTTYFPSFDYQLVQTGYGTYYTNMFGKLYRHDNENEEVIFPSNSIIKHLDTEGLKVDRVCEGFLLIKDNNSHLDYIDHNGNSLLGTFILKDNKIIWTKESLYDDAQRFKKGFAIVKKNNKCNLIDHEGKLVFDKWYDDLDLDRQGLYIGIDNRKKCALYPYLEDYKVRPTLFGFNISNDNDSYTIKYIPLKRFGIRYTLCLDDNKSIYYLYDDVTREYIRVGAGVSVTFDNDFLYSADTKKVYYFYNNTMYDITSYYKNNLFDKYNVNITSCNIKIMTKDEFRDKYLEDASRLVKEEKEENERIRIEKQRNKDKNNLRILKEKSIREEEIRKAELKKSLAELKDLLNRIRDLSNKDDKIVRLPIDIPFIEVDDHLEIPSELLDVLKYIDLSSVSFKNVKVSGIDFTGCNIESINPQEVYNKDLSNCNFEGIGFLPRVNFDGVDIRGSKFSDDNDDKTLNISPYSLVNSIYDDNTTYDGIKLREVLNSPRYKI